MSLIDSSTNEALRKVADDVQKFERCILTCRIGSTFATGAGYRQMSDSKMGQLQQTGITFKSIYVTSADFPSKIWKDNSSTAHQVRTRMYLSSAHIDLPLDMTGVLAIRLSYKPSIRTQKERTWLTPYGTLLQLSVSSQPGNDSQACAGDHQRPWPSAPS